MFRDVFGPFIQHLIPAGALIAVCTWASALFGAGIAYVFQSEATHHSVGGFLRYCFPVHILRHSSCRIDAMNYAIRWLLDPFVIAPLTVSTTVVALAVTGGLGEVFGHRVTAPAPLWLGVAVLAVTVALMDFADFYLHYKMHRIVSLWELHKTHHSAEFLLPITNSRFHPLQAVIGHFAKAIPVGLFLGVAIYGLAMPARQSWIMGGGGYFLLNTVSFYHLRHSHIYLCYGRFERYFMSPAQHQLHHSFEAEHWDKNFGLLFSCWDRMFGTIVYARPGDRFRVGLPPQYRQDYDSIWKLYATPVIGLARMARRWAGGWAGRILAPAARGAAAPDDRGETRPSATADAGFAD